MIIVLESPRSVGVDHNELLRWQKFSVGKHPSCSMCFLTYALQDPTLFPLLWNEADLSGNGQAFILGPATLGRYEETTHRHPGSGPASGPVGSRYRCTHSQITLTLILQTTPVSLTGIPTLGLTSLGLGVVCYMAKHIWAKDLTRLL